MHFHSGFVPEHVAIARELEVPYVVAPNGAYSQANYNAHSQPTQMTDEGGSVTTYSYDTGGNLLTQNALLLTANPDGTHLFYSYDTHGRLSESHLDGNAEKSKVAHLAPQPIRELVRSIDIGGARRDLVRSELLDRCAQHVDVFAERKIERGEIQHVRS